GVPSCFLGSGGFSSPFFTTFFFSPKRISKASRCEGAPGADLAFSSFAFLASGPSAWASRAPAGRAGRFSPNRCWNAAPSLGAGAEGEAAAGAAAGAAEGSVVVDEDAEAAGAGAAAGGGGGAGGALRSLGPKKCWKALGA